MLDPKISLKLIEAGVKYIYPCWVHFKMTEVKMQLVNDKNYWVKLELLCEPLAEHNYVHVYFYVPIPNNDETPNPELQAIQYPRSIYSKLDTFTEDDIVVNATMY